MMRTYLLKKTISRPSRYVSSSHGHALLYSERFQRANEEFFHEFVAKLDSGVVGNCEYALQETARPDVKQVKSALLGHELRIGDSENHPGQGIKLQVKASKCTALARPKSWKRFARLKDRDGKDVIMKSDEDAEEKFVFTQLLSQTAYYVEGETKEDVDGEDEDVAEKGASQEQDKLTPKPVDKEELVRGFKYGASFVPNPDGSYLRLPTQKGIDICGFFNMKRFRRDQAGGHAVGAALGAVRARRQLCRIDRRIAGVRAVGRRRLAAAGGGGGIVGGSGALVTAGAAGGVATAGWRQARSFVAGRAREGHESHCQLDEDPPSRRTRSRPSALRRPRTGHRSRRSRGRRAAWYRRRPR